LLFSDLTGPLQLFGSVSYTRPDGSMVQSAATYFKGGDVAKKATHSLQFDIATDMWGSATKTEGIYDPEELAINIIANPLSVISNSNYTVTVDYINAQSKLFMIEKDGAVLYNWQNYQTPISLSEEGQYIIRAEATNSIGENETAELPLIIDKTVPVITLTGDDEVTIETDSDYIDAGAIALDNVDGDLTSNIVVVNNVDETTVGDYTVTYDVIDSAGNNAVQVKRTIHVIGKVVPITSPDFTVTALEGKNFKVEWTGNGADSYIIKINGNTDPNGSVAANAEEVYSRTISVSDYGTYSIALIAVKGSVESTDFKNHSVELKAAITTTGAATETPVSTPAPVISAAPSKAQAAEEPQPTENKVETSADDSNGQIKGDESSDENGEEKINWTPWIVLFVLILLAGAATGGYFYWFNGEDEVQAVVREPKKELSSVKTADDKGKKEIKKPNNQKKQKRW